MKNTAFLAALIAVLTVLVPKDSMAQNEVVFPVDRYLNWQWEELAPVNLRWRSYCSSDRYWFGGIESETNDSVYLGGMRRMIIAEPFHTPKADSNTTHTIYGVAIPMFGNSIDYGLLDFSFPIDIAVYTGREGDTTVTLVTRQSFYFDSSRAPSPDIWMRFSESTVLPTYEFYFSHPITVTGLFFVGAGCGKEFPSKPIYGGRVKTSYIEPAYTNVAICDDYHVEDYTIDIPCGAFRASYVLLNYELPRWGYPGRLAIPIPDVDQPYMGSRPYVMTTTQGYYPILQPRSTEAVEMAKPETLRLMPNPASEKVTLVADCPIRSYRIVDMAGRTVLSGTPASTATTTTVSIRALPRGIYCVQVETANGHHTQKLSVQ